MKIEPTKLYTDSELKSLPPVDGAFLSPFAEAVTGKREAEHPELFDSARRWATIHIENAYAEPAAEVESDPFDAVFGALDGQRLWHEVRKEGALTGVHPVTAMNDSEWNDRTIQMHGQQRMTELSPKPIQSNLAERKTLVRGS